MKIAMWSGPRNLSTAMMYSFGNRADMQVWDEPFYAAYLAATGVKHPMGDDVISGNEADPEAVCKKINEAEGNLFLKLMGFHMEDAFPLDWAKDCVHVHLIRHPARVIASYAAKREKPNLKDIGFEQQSKLYRQFPGPVISSFDIRSNPEAMLRKLCSEIGLPFEPAMLHWPAGPKSFDGNWAPHWYDAVHRSKGFAGAEGNLPDLSGHELDLMNDALPFYEELQKVKI